MDERLQDQLNEVNRQIEELEGKATAGTAPADATQQLDTLKQRRVQLKDQIQQAQQASQPERRSAQGAQSRGSRSRGSREGTRRNTR